MGKFSRSNTKNLFQKKIKKSGSKLPSVPKESSTKVSETVSSSLTADSSIEYKSQQSKTTVSSKSKKLKDTTSITKVKSLFSMESMAAFHRTLVIPFSGFTENDVREIRGETSTPVKPKFIKNQLAPKRSVLKRYQSERRKSSYEQYIKDMLHRKADPKNSEAVLTTEDSSYNTVIALKILVDKSVSFSELSVNGDADGIEDKKVVKKDSETKPIVSDLMITKSLPKLDLDVLNEPKIDLQMELQLRNELKMINEQLVRAQMALKNAEKEYFAAKYNLHMIQSKKDNLAKSLADTERTNRTQQNFNTE